MIRKHKSTKRERIKRKIVGASEKNLFKNSIKVYKSNLYTYAFVCDASGKILKSFSTKGLKGKKTDTSKEMGLLVGDYINKEKIADIYFNRSGFRYIGRIKLVADGIREKGVKI